MATGSRVAVIIRAARFLVSVLGPVALVAVVLWGYDHVAKPRKSGLVEVIQGEVEASIGAPVTRTLAVAATIAPSTSSARTWLVGYEHGVYMMRAAGLGELTFYSGGRGESVDLTAIVRAHYKDRINRISIDTRRRMLYVGGIHARDIGMFRIMHGGRALEYERTVRLPPDVDLRWRIQSGQDGWLGVGYLVDALVYSLREEGPGTLSVVRKLGQTLYPDIRAPLVAGEISESAVALSPDGERFAQAFMYNSRVHTYRSDGTLERRIAGPVDVRLEISRLYDHRDNQEKTSRTNETKLAYLDVAADNTRIAALFAGRRYASFEGKGALSGNEVHVFSWTGECLDVVRLSEDVMAIAIEPTDGSLWGSAPDGRVLRFQALGR